MERTDPFSLPAGRYKATFSFKAGCAYYVDLRDVKDEVPSMSVGTGDGPVDGTNNLYAVPAGEYYLNVNTGPVPECPWSVALTSA